MEEEFRFKQGQNLTVRINKGGEEIRRSYSICSSPLEKELRIAVKRVEGGRFSMHAMSLKRGDTLEVLAPTGTFYTELNPANRKNYLAFGAGSGITPLLSIIKTTLATEPESRFTLLYGNRTRSSIIFREELETLKNRYMDRFNVFHLLSREETEAPLSAGRIDGAKCRALTGKLIDIKNVAEFFICGPEEMIFTVKAFLEEQGVPKERIHFELFTTPGQKAGGEAVSTAESGAIAGEELTSEVTVMIDGQHFNFTLPYHDQSILDAALYNGADVPYSCKGGVCGTCRAKLLKGEVEMDANYALEQDELDAGYILTCQSHPRTPVVEVDYDE